MNRSFCVLLSVLLFCLNIPSIAAQKKKQSRFNGGAIRAQAAHQNASAGGPPQSFFQRSDYPVGASPFSSATGDFNGDGIPDLAIVNEGANTVSIMLGTGDGGFRDGGQFATGNGPISAVITDINNDGIADLAVLNEGDDSVSILLGNGDGSFGNKTDVAVAHDPAAIVAGDLNQDGNVDLAVVSRGADSISILLGDGTGAFTRTDIASGNRFPHTLAIGDFNGDGIPDLAYTAPDGNFTGSFDVLWLMLGNGDGSFTQNAASGGPTAQGIAAGDLNGDGLDDLVITYQGCGHTVCQGVAALLSNGDGSFQGASNTDVSTLQYFNLGAPFIGDFNNDGIPDIAFLGTFQNSDTGVNHIKVWFGRGDGEFTPGYDIFLQGTVRGPLSLGDFSQDGRLDVAVPVVSDNRVSVFLNQDAPCPLNPESPSVTICSPGEEVAFPGSPMAVLAAVSDDSPVNEMQIFIDGEKWYEEVGANALDTQIVVPQGTHELMVQAFDQAGRTFSASRMIIINRFADPACPLGPTPKPTIRPYAYICEPLGGLTRNSPVSLTAEGTPPGLAPIDSLNVFVDDANVLTLHVDSVHGFNMNMPSGQHRVTVQFTDTAGATWDSSVIVNVP